MLINFLKFIHVLFALGIISLTAVGLFSKESVLIFRLNLFLFFLGLMSLITGSVLVYPKNFTFHTPWIEAAFLLVSLFSAIILALIVFKRKISHFPEWTLKLTYFSLLGILLLVVHDAVSKSSYLF